MLWVVAFDVRREYSRCRSSSTKTYWTEPMRQSYLKIIFTWLLHFRVTEFDYRFSGDKNVRSTWFESCDGHARFVWRTLPITSPTSRPDRPRRSEESIHLERLPNEMSVVMLLYDATFLLCTFLLIRWHVWTTISCHHLSSVRGIKATETTTNEWHNVTIIQTLFDVRNLGAILLLHQTFSIPILQCIELDYL